MQLQYNVTVYKFQEFIVNHYSVLILPQVVPTKSTIYAPASIYVMYVKHYTAIYFFRKKELLPLSLDNNSNILYHISWSCNQGPVSQKSFVSSSFLQIANGCIVIFQKRFWVTNFVNIYEYDVYLDFVKCVRMIERKLFHVANRSLHVANLVKPQVHKTEDIL